MVGQFSSPSPLELQPAKMCSAMATGTNLCWELNLIMMMTLVRL